MPAVNLIFFRSCFILFFAVFRLRSKGKSLIPAVITPLLVRNISEMLAVLFLFVSIKFIPFSTFTILFNSKGIFIYLFETILTRKMPPSPHIFCCVLSFIGMILVVSPTKSPDTGLRVSKLSHFLGIWGVLAGTACNGVSDVYLNHTSIALQEIKLDREQNLLFFGVCCACCAGLLMSFGSQDVLMSGSVLLHSWLSLLLVSFLGLFLQSIFD